MQWASSLPKESDLEIVHILSSYILLAIFLTSCNQLNGLLEMALGGTPFVQLK